MKKTISINLNRQVFNLDTDAYSKLNDYLSDIKEHFNETDSSEIIDDIESRIAEKFIEILGKTKKVVQIEDVDQVIADMGSVSDIAGDDAPDETTKDDKSSSPRKKLFRDTDSKIIAGVASGLAWYFGIRSLFIRLIFIILLFNRNTSWLSLATYFACWLIIPKAKNNFEKLEMKGRPTTINELQTASETKISGIISSVETKTQNIFQKIFSLFFRLIKFCFKWGLQITGFFCFITNILLIVCLVVGFVLLYFNQFFPYIDLTFLKSINSPALEIAFISLGLSFLMPIVFCLDLSEDLMRLKWNTSFKKVLLMLVIWVFSLITFATTAKITYPQYQSQLTAFVDHFKYFTTIDETNSQTINIKNIQSVDISNVRQVKLVQSNENVLIITGNQHQIEELNTQVSSDEINIQGKSATWAGCNDCLGYVSSVRIEIRTPNINNVKLNNTDAELQTQSGNYQINLVKKTGLKITGNSNAISLTAGHDTVTNLLDATVNQVDAQLLQSTLKTAAKIIKIKGDSQSVLIYKNQSQIIPQSGDQSQKQKYILSQDHEKLVKTLESTVVNLDGFKKTLKDFNWSSNFEIESDVDFYHIYTFVKPQNTTNVYILWLVEKNGVVTLNKSFKIANWEDVHYLNLVNDKFIQINGQVYGPELKEETKEIYIDKIKNTLQIKPISEENF